MVYFNKMKSNLGGLSCTRGPPQPKDYVTSVREEIFLEFYVIERAKYQLPRDVAW